MNAYTPGRTEKVLAISGKAHRVFRFVSLIAARFGDMKIGEIARGSVSI